MAAAGQSSDLVLATELLQVVIANDHPRLALVGQIEPKKSTKRYAKALIHHGTFRTGKMLIIYIKTLESFRLIYYYFDLLFQDRASCVAFPG